METTFNTKTAHPSAARVAISALMMIGAVATFALALLLVDDKGARYWLAFIALFIVFAAFNRASDLLAPGGSMGGSPHPAAIRDVTEAVADGRITASEGAEMVRAIKGQSEPQQA